MCLAIAKPAGSIIPIKNLLDGFTDNPHGAGYAFASDGMLRIRKGFFDFDHFMDDYDKYVTPDNPAIVHFRWATSGCINRKNCHPFLVSRDIAMVHNGVLPWRSSRKHSDTACFAKDVLAPNSEFIHHDWHRKGIENFVGPHNKMAFLDAAGRMSIYHEGSGEWVDGVWFSKPQIQWIIPDDPSPGDWPPTGEGDDEFRSYDDWHWDDRYKDKFSRQEIA